MKTPEEYQTEGIIQHKDEQITRLQADNESLRSQVEQLQGRCAELEAAGAKAAMRWSDAQAGFQSEDLMVFRAVLESGNSKARDLRLQAEAVDTAADALALQGESPPAIHALRLRVQRLRDQAGEIERGGGDE